MVRPDIIVKTLLGMERVTASRIEELGFNVNVEPKPKGFPGLVTLEVKRKSDGPKLAEAIKREIPEAERVLLSEEVVNADMDEIVKAAVKVSTRHLSPDITFAVRTVRRGTHQYKSIDVNYKAGSAIIEATGASVNLDYPDKIVWVEIIGEVAAIGIADKAEIWRKMKPGKVEVRNFFRKVSVVQIPYLGPRGSIRPMGSRIGRAVQMFEVGEYVVAVVGSVKGWMLNLFLEGLLEGVESRYNIQRRTYAHRPHRVEVVVQDLYQLVRERKDEPKIVFEPEGEPFPEVAERLAEMTASNDVARVNMLFGSREGVPKGVFRFVDMVIDLCPGITLSTEYAASSALIGLAYALEEHLKKANV